MGVLNTRHREAVKPTDDKQKEEDMDAIAIDTLRKTVNTLAIEAAEEAHHRGYEPGRPSSGFWGNFFDNADVAREVKACFDSQDPDIDEDEAWTIEDVQEDAGEKFAGDYTEHLTFLYERGQ